jgi:hypothetical protein
MHILAKREKEPSLAKEPWKVSTLYSRVDLRISPKNQSLCGRILNGTLQEGYRDVFAEGGEGSSVANGS